MHTLDHPANSIAHPAPGPGRVSGDVPGTMYMTPISRYPSPNASYVTQDRQDAYRKNIDDVESVQSWRE